MVSKRKRTVRRPRKVITKRYQNHGNFKIANSIQMYNNRLPFPRQMITKLNYSENQVISVGTTGVYGTELIFSLNDLFDPRFTSGGHQPLGRDQLAGLYNRYIVNAVLIHIEFSDPTTVDMINVAVIIESSSNSFALTNNGIEYVNEKPNSWTRNISQTGEQRATFNQYVSCHKLEGVDRYKWNNSLTEYGAVMTTSPSNKQYVRIACSDPRSGSSGGCLANVKLTYFCKLFDQLLLADS